MLQISSLMTGRNSLYSSSIVQKFIADRVNCLMNNGQRHEKKNIIWFISIVPINVHQFIDDSEIYDTIIMMHFWTGWVQDEEGVFMALHLQERHVGAKANATFSILLFYDSLSIWPLLVIERATVETMAI